MGVGVQCAVVPVLPVLPCLAGVVVRKMYFRLLFFFVGVIGSVLGLGSNNQRNEFWGDLIFHSNVKNDRFVSTDVNRRHLQEQPAPQVLMTECPLNSRCVGRNFCDEKGLITTFRNNKLKFSEDNRGLIACVDTERNRLGVCCIDKFRVINGRRRVRQDDLLKVSEDGVVTLDTLPGGLDEGLINEEDEALEEQFFVLDDSSGKNKNDKEIKPDPTVSLTDEDIENIVQSVKEKDGRTPSIIMVNDEADPGENVAVRFLADGQVPGSQAGPIVVINIHADSLGLGGRDGDRDISRIKTKLSENTKLAPIEVEKSIPKDINENEYEYEDEATEEKDIPDYLDFDTDFITITMETDYQDDSAFRGDYNGNSFRRNLVRRPGSGNSFRNRRPDRRPARQRRPVFRFRSDQY